MNRTNKRIAEHSEYYSPIIDQMENVFFFLINEAQIRDFNTDEILEIPTFIGQTCFSRAASTSKKISRYILERNIKVNTINVSMDIPRFHFPDSSLQMMKKGINPYVISYDGGSEIERYPSSFETPEQKIMSSKFSRSIHYSLEDIECSPNCEPECPSKFRRFFFKDGPLVEMNDKNRIGEGGFGMVFKFQFHGKEMAAKCVWMGDNEFVPDVRKLESNLKENIIEYTIQRQVNAGMLMPKKVIFSKPCCFLSFDVQKNSSYHRS